MSERTPLLPKGGADPRSVLNALDYWLILPVILLNMFLAAFETTIAASTQSSVGATFHATDNIAWVATSYLIVSTAVQPLYGRAADLFGRTGVYVFSLVFFGLGCLACGLSQSLWQMVAARALCGIGGGGLITISQVVAWDIVPTGIRPIYQAINNVTYGLGAAIGATLGGFMADSIGWRWAYFVPVPLCVLSVLIFLWRATPRLRVLAQQEGKDRSSLKVEDIDFLGSALLMIVITLVMVVINLGGDEIPWTSPAIPVILLVALILGVVFVRHEKRFPLPVLPIKLMKGRYMWGQIGLNIFGPMTVFAALYLIPPFFQTTLFTSASVASRRLLYPTLTAPLGSVMTGLFLQKYHNQAHIGQRLGTVLLVIGSGIMLLLTFEDTSGRSEIWFIAHLIWVHLGMGILFPSTLLDILSCTGKDHASATSLIFLLRSVGTVLGISASQAMLQNVLLVQLRKHIVGPGSGKIIKGVRQSLDYLISLPPDVRATAVACYNIAFRASFILVMSIAACAVMSSILGIGARKPDEEEDEERATGADAEAEVTAEATAVVGDVQEHS